MSTTEVCPGDGTCLTQCGGCECNEVEDTEVRVWEEECECGELDKARVMWMYHERKRLNRMPNDEEIQEYIDMDVADDLRREFCTCFTYGVKYIGPCECGHRGHRTDICPDAEAQGCCVAVPCHQCDRRCPKWLLNCSPYSYCQTCTIQRRSTNE